MISVRLPAIEPDTAQVLVERSRHRCGRRSGADLAITPVAGAMAASPPPEALTSTGSPEARPRMAITRPMALASQGPGGEIEEADRRRGSVAAEGDPVRDGQGHRVAYGPVPACPFLQGRRIQPRQPLVRGDEQVAAFERGHASNPRPTRPLRRFQSTPKVQPSKPE